MYSCKYIGISLDNEMSLQIIVYNLDLKCFHSLNIIGS